MTIAALVDFGNTLADETFMRHNSARFPEWTTHYGEVLDRVRSDWDTGVIGSDDVAREVAAALGCASAEVDRYIDELCRDITFFPVINAALDRRRARGQLQAVVTVNCDVFARVVDFYDLGARFDAIVASYEIGSDRKTDICTVACERLGISPAQSVLIDNIETNVDSWRAAGGLGYVFATDEQFAADVRSGLVPGFDRDDLVTTK